MEATKTKQAKYARTIARAARKLREAGMYEESEALIRWATEQTAKMK